MIPGEFLSKYEVYDFAVEKEFHSKKNRVLKLRLNSENNELQRVVAKIFEDADSARYETHIAQKLLKRDCPVPDVLYIGEHMMITEFIKGKVLVDLLFEDREFPVCDVISSLERIYRSLWDIDPSLILRDMNMRNFIFEKEQSRVFRVDLESVSEGDVCRDVGQLVAFCISYDPPFTDKLLKTGKQLFDQLNCVLDLSAQKSRNLDDVRHLCHYSGLIR